jgi:hypothetical protein
MATDAVECRQLPEDAFAQVVDTLDLQLRQRAQLSTTETTVRRRTMAHSHTRLMFKRCLTMACVDELADAGEQEGS